MPSQNEPARLGTWDAVSLIVGIIIGVGIFETPRDVFQAVPGPYEAMLVWLAGGLLAFVGALCFAELASAYPHSGGEYNYLTRAFGPLVGFLFAWAQLAVIRPAGLGAVAFVFSQQVLTLAGIDENSNWGVSWAAAAIIFLTGINILGVTIGKHLQNLLTLAKVLGLTAVVGVGVLFAQPHIGQMELAPAKPGWFATSMILVLWTYAGWHEAAYIASEVHDGPRSIPRALLLGTAIVTFIYLMVNAALLMGMGFDGGREHQVIDVVKLAWPRGGTELVALGILLSALGALHGMIFTTARIYAAIGRDHRLFTPLAHWSKRVGTPVRALVVQGLITLAYLLYVALLGTGKETLKYLIDMTAAVFWIFFLLAGCSLFVLRRIDPDIARPFRVPGYPVLPILFCASCAYMVYGSVRWAPMASLLSVLVLLAGWPFYYFPQKKRRAT